MTLTEFLTARLDEDEVAWQMVARDVVEVLMGKPLAPQMLTDIDAKRRIVDSYRWQIDNADRPFAYERIRETRLVERHVKLLALPYAGHPDYDESWRP